MSVPLYIIAGGRSSRFGSDKARAEIDGQPLIVRTAAALGAMVSSITVVADAADKYADIGLRTIADDEPGLGPLGGLATALRHCGQPWLLLAACDMAVVKPAWVRCLLAAGEAATDAEAVAFRGEQWQPMPGLYGQAILPRVIRRLEAEQRAMQGLLDEAKSVALPLPDDWPAIAQINTPADLKSWQSPRQGDGN